MHHYVVVLRSTQQWPCHDLAVTPVRVTDGALHQIVQSDNRYALCLAGCMGKSFVN